MSSDILIFYSSDMQLFGLNRIGLYYPRLGRVYFLISIQETFDPLLYQISFFNKIKSSFLTDLIRIYRFKIVTIWHILFDFGRQIIFHLQKREKQETNRRIERDRRAT